MCSKKLDFKSCAIMFGFRKFSHICSTSIICMANCLQQGRPSMNAYSVSKDCMSMATIFAIDGLSGGTTCIVTGPVKLVRHRLLKL